MKCLFGIIFIFNLIALIAGEKIIFCYWRSISSLNNSNPSLCTHVSYAFEEVEFDGIVKNTANMALFSTLKGIYPDVKFMVSIVGFGATSAFQNISDSANLRDAFAESVLSYLQINNLDGVDINWEFPDNQADNFSLLLEALYNRLNPLGYILSTAAGADNNKASSRYDVPKIAQNVDFINLMTYNYHGSWESTTGIGAPLYSSTNTIYTVHKTAQDWISKIGNDTNKLVLGMPLYGPSWNLTSNDTNVGAPGIAIQTSLRYYQICDNIQNGWTRMFDEVQKGPYAFGDDVWVGYDDAESIQEKLNYIESHGMGGVFFWEMSMDDSGNICGDGEFPLMTLVKNTLLGSGDTTTSTTTTTSTESTSSTESSSSSSTESSSSSSTTEVPTTTQSSGLKQAHNRILFSLQLSIVLFTICKHMK